MCSRGKCRYLRSLHAGATLASERTEKRLAVVLSLVRFGRPRRERHSSLLCGPRAASTPLSHPVVLLRVQASLAAVAVAAHRSMTTPRSSWGGGDGDLDHAGVRPAAERRRRTAPSSRGRRLRPTSELPADSPAACTFASTLSTSARCASDGRCGAAGGLRQHRYQPARLRASPAGAVAVGGGDVGVAERLSMRTTVTEPCDSAGCATLISDTGSGRLPIALRRGRGDCRRNVRGLNGWLHRFRTDR
jgi:hypothetical protein